MTWYGVTKLCTPPVKRWDKTTNSRWVGVTKLCTPQPKQWHNPDGSLWEPSKRQKTGDSAFRLDVEESTQEVYAAVDEVSNSVFNSTSPLPPSTSSPTTTIRPTDPPMTNLDSRDGEMIQQRASLDKNVAKAREGGGDLVDGDNDMLELIDDSEDLLSKPQGDKGTHKLNEEGNTEKDTMLEADAELVSSMTKQQVPSTACEVDELDEDIVRNETSDEAVMKRQSPSTERRGDDECSDVKGGDMREVIEREVLEHLAGTSKGLQQPDTDEIESVLEVLDRAEPATLGIDNGDEESMAEEVDAESGESDRDGISTGSLSDVEPKIWLPRRRSTLRGSPRVIVNVTPNTRRKMTGMTSKHFSCMDLKEEEPEVPIPTTPNPITPKRTPKRTTGTKSPHFITDRVDQYNTTASSRRVPAGTSIVPVPPISSPAFGIVQEKLWQEPFWLLIAVTFLNKTTGRSAMPIFWKLKKRFPTAKALAKADPKVLLELVSSLGFQNQRSERLVNMAKAWLNQPPVKGIANRTLHYPAQGDGLKKELKADVVEEDVPVCKGSLEIGHIPGCGPYAFDSWRVFCRDVLRGVAEDYDGKGAEGKDFEPEWKRVLPGDKELRACLRWMWMREGYVWDALTGERREATEAEMEKAKAGEMLIEDEEERKFAKQAAEVDADVGAKEFTPIKREQNIFDDTVVVRRRTSSSSNIIVARPDG